MTQARKYNYSRELILIAILLALGTLFLLYKSQQNDEQALVLHTIELNQNGFSPATSTINRGDTVRFISTRDVQFWPASNEHPVHSVYPEFDPLRPLDPNEVWEFVFSKRGAWEYHDHLYSFFSGIIIVR